MKPIRMKGYFTSVLSFILTTSHSRLLDTINISWDLFCKKINYTVKQSHTRTEWNKSARF